MHKGRTSEENLALLEFLIDHDNKQAAAHFKISETAIRAWTLRIRRQITSLQTYVNRVRTLQRISPRVRKITTDGRIRKEEIEDWEQEKEND